MLSGMSWMNEGLDSLNDRNNQRIYGHEHGVKQKFNQNVKKKKKKTNMNKFDQFKMWDIVYKMEKKCETQTKITNEHNEKVIL